MFNQWLEKEVTIIDDPFLEKKTSNSLALQVKQQRTKLWELDHNYHCAVIGTCLTLDEVKKLLRSFLISVENTNSYDIHTAIVTIISYNDYRSKKVQSYLNKKFKAALHKTKKMNAAELIQEWKRVVNSGELIATFWAVIAHPCTDEKMKRDFYGDIHMQSHMSGASHRVDIRRLDQLENERKKVDSNALVQQEKFKKIQAENLRLKQENQRHDEKKSDFNNRIMALTNANEQLTIINGVEEIERLNIQISRLKHKVDFQANEMETHEECQIKMRESFTSLEHQVEKGEQSITEYKNEIEHLQYVLNQNKSEDKCIFKKQGLCGQCVLYVGGKANLIPHYRELIEAKSGIFLYHDGGIEKNTQDLSQSLNRADLVIFPSDCISHDAYWKIKTVCKKQQKPYEYLNSPGLHSLSKALDSVVNEG